MKRRSPGSGGISIGCSRTLWRRGRTVIPSARPTCGTGGFTICLTDPRIVALVKDLLGENVIAWGSHFFCKMPHDGKQVAWHQDASYWPLNALESGHRLAGDRRCRHRKRLHAVHRRLASSRAPDLPPRRFRRAQRAGADDRRIRCNTAPIVDDVLQAGEASLHSDLLLHGSEANNSDRRRCGLTLRYCAADVRAGMSWNQKGVIVSGEDPTGHWANPPRPLND